MITKIHKEGWKLIGSVLIILAIVWLVIPERLRLFVLLVGVPILSFLCYFFRDPERQAAISNHVSGRQILAPSDGTIFKIERNGNRQKIYVYLSPMDVHVNRIPCDGVVKNVEYIPGTFSLAWTDKASKENESCLTEIETSTHCDGSEYGHNNGHGNGMGDVIGVRQIAGRLARQIVNNLEVGQQVQQGERFGIICFGSQVEISMPGEYQLTCQVGDRLVGGETIIANKNIKKNLQSLMNLTKTEEYIAKRIAEDNFCIEDSDCVTIPSFCPFGCCPYVNKYKSEEIEHLLNKIQERCYYDCLPCKKPKCIKNKCRASRS